jgi:hypothetical protein
VNNGLVSAAFITPTAFDCGNKAPLSNVGYKIRRRLQDDLTSSKKELMSDRGVSKLRPPPGVGRLPAPEPKGATIGMEMMETVEVHFLNCRRVPRPHGAQSARDGDRGATK